MLYTENIVYLNSPKQMREDAFNLAKYVQCNHKVQICTHAQWIVQSPAGIVGIVHSNKRCNKALLLIKLTSQYAGVCL